MTMTYEESVKYLYKIAGFATKSSLEDIKYFLERLGNPQKELHMIHVAGTNGKGSVCAFLEALLTQHGKKTASFTSPHVVKINERIKLCAKEISDERFASAAVKVRHAIETGITEGKNSPSFCYQCYLSEGQCDHFNQRRSYGISGTNIGRDRNTQSRDH